ncbi:hypothetical protein AAIR98_001386 [Elusimicrobium simillimum]|uniref:metallophosphoesterase n=1 Tax=Elusimicrobium simillimum TaxID=3143438 RepID=UPI003C700197
MIMVLQLALVVVLNIYLPWRIGGGLQSKIWLYALFAAGIASALIVMQLVTKYDNVLVNAYYNITSAWLGIFLYLTCFMVIFEVINLIHRLPRSASAWVIIGLTAAVAVYSLINAAVFKTVSVDITLKNLKQEVRVAQITDVHLGAARGKNYLQKIINKTNELKPDIVVITGDITDSKVALTKNMFTPLKDLQAPAYFVSGNHDVYVGLPEILAKIRENNVRVLQNETLLTNGIKLIGLNYMKADDSVYDPHQVTDETIKDTLPTLDLSGDMPKVVLHHGPWGLEYMNEHGVDLVIAGHTHGGQLFPATFLAKAAFPYNKGLAEYKGTRIYVSQGVGTFLPKMRLGTNNELTLITLKPAN